MKILIIYHYNGLGGGVLSGIDIARALSKEYNVKISVPLISKNLKDKINGFNHFSYINSPCVPTFSYYNGGSGFLKSIAKYVLHSTNFDEWKEFLDAEKPDLLIYNSIVQWPLFSYLSKFKIPSICFVRETMRGKLFWPINSYLKKKLELLNGVVFLTDFDKKQWLGNKGNIDNWIVIPHMVDRSRFSIPNFLSIEELKRQEGLNKTEFHVLYLGGFNKIKGIDQIIKAFQSLPHNIEVRLIILGECITHSVETETNPLLKIRKLLLNNYRKRISKKIDKINSTKNQILVKGLQTDVGKWYNICDLVVFPVKKVHQSRPVYEAGIHKKTIIVPDYENFQDNLINNFNGLYYKKKSSKDLANKIQSLYNDRDYCQWLGSNNYNLTIRNHEFQKISNEVREYTEKILNSLD